MSMSRGILAIIEVRKMDDRFEKFFSRGWMQAFILWFMNSFLSNNAHDSVVSIYTTKNKSQTVDLGMCSLNQG